MTVVQYLSQGELLQERITYCMRRISELRSRVDGVSAVRTDAERTDHRCSDDPSFVRMLEHIWEMQDRVNRDMELMIRLECQMDRVIRQLLNGEYRLVLCYRYLMREPWNRVAELLHANVRTVQRWHEKAVSLITLPEDAIDIRAGDPGLPSAG